MLWRGLMVATNSQSPVVVVLSGSMEPGFYRGDILFLYNRKSITIGKSEVFIFFFLLELKYLLENFR